MTEYISPVLGVIKENVYETLMRFRNKNLVNEMRKHRFGIFRTGVLLMETEYEFAVEVNVKGSEIVKRLIDSYGFRRNHAVDVARIFSANKLLVRDLLKKGFNESDVIYGLSYKERLAELGLKRLSDRDWETSTA